MLFSFYTNEKIQFDEFNKIPVAQHKGDDIVNLAKAFLNKPYTAHFLEKKPEHLIISFDHVDCVTLVENILALHLVRTMKGDFDNFQEKLSIIRYRNAQIGGYASRLHYLSEWLLNLEQRKIMTNVTSTYKHYKTINKPINYVSSHPKMYHFDNIKDDLIIFKDIERSFSSKPVDYLPKNEIIENFNQFKNGDLVAIRSSIRGLDYAHLGIIYFKNGAPHLIHASSQLHKVVISSENLNEYLAKNKQMIGISVYR
ncbi:MAG: DUF1460 domain-containing protein [Saprospiraceae bacterium]|nr:DUF1460 domain-containing protein [Saprospiraceae bacterium]